MGTIVALCRYPVKSMLGESVAAARVTDRGLDGDRVFAVLDRDGTVGSAKHPRKWGALLRCRVRTSEGGAEVVMPDGAVFGAGDPKLDESLSELLGRPVTMSSAPAARGGRLEREVPDYAGGTPEMMLGHATVDGTGARITAGTVADGTFFDFGQLHLITTGTLGTLGADHRRFRPNLVVDTGAGAGTGFPEDAWLGSSLRIGTGTDAAIVDVNLPTPRCAVPALRHGDLPADPGPMRTAAALHRIPVADLGRLTCAGVYLSVRRPGLVRVGDPITRIEAPGIA